MSSSEGELPVFFANTNYLRKRLHKLRDDHRRYRRYLAICQYDLEQQRRHKDTWALEGWVSRRARKKRERLQLARERRNNRAKRLRDVERLLGLPVPPSPSPSQIEAEARLSREALEERIAAYEQRVYRTSVQLLTAAAAGHQFRETNLATRKGRLVRGVDTGGLRKYRAFDVRSTPSLSSTEAGARLIKNWVNNARARKANPSKGGGDNDDRVSLDSSVDSDEFEALAEVGIALAMSSGAENKAEPGDWADKIVDPVIEMFEKRFAIGDEADVGLTPKGTPLAGSDPSLRLPLAHQPPPPDPYTYDPRRWRNLPETSASESFKTAPEFLKEPDYTEIGVRTWKELNKTYPTIDSVLAKSEHALPIWDPDRRELEEDRLKDYSTRPPLEADLTTKVSLERARDGYGRLEANPMYTDYEYPQFPAILPPKLSDEEMKRGPKPSPQMLPLEYAGREISIAAKPAEELPTYRLVSKRHLEDLEKPLKLPAPSYHYPIDSPATSTFRFTDGRSVADVFKPGRLDEPDQVRGSQALVDRGKEIEKQQANLRKPYTYEGMVKPIPPEEIREGGELMPAPDEAMEVERVQTDGRAGKILKEIYDKAKVRREAYGESQQSAPRSQLPTRFVSSFTPGYLPQPLVSHPQPQPYISSQPQQQGPPEGASANSNAPFWHYAAMRDGESALHNGNGKSTNNGDAGTNEAGQHSASAGTPGAGGMGQAFGTVPQGVPEADHGDDDGALANQQLLDESSATSGAKRTVRFGGTQTFGHNYGSSTDSDSGAAGLAGRATAETARENHSLEMKRRRAQRVYRAETHKHRIRKRAAQRKGRPPPPEAPGLVRARSQLQHVMEDIQDVLGRAGRGRSTFLGA